jgi:radical SAM-linked protein
MAPDTPLDRSLSSSEPGPPLGLVKDKVRIRFRKAGSLRFLGHQDLQRTWQRLLRRAAIPFCTTQGFNPRPRLVFALSLPLGVAGQREVAELELTDVVEPDEIHRRLSDQAPPGLEILEVRRIQPRSSAQVRRLCYGFSVSEERIPLLEQRAGEVLAQEECWVQRARPGKGTARPVNLRPFLHQIRFEGRDAHPLLLVELWLTRAGTARPEEILTLLGLKEQVQPPSAEPTRADAIFVERTWLELEDEVSAEQRDHLEIKGVSYS